MDHLLPGAEGGEDEAAEEQRVEQLAKFQV